MADTAVAAIPTQVSPKRPLNSYVLFVRETRMKLAAENGGQRVKANELTKEIAEKWNKLPEGDKAPYIERALKAKAEYEQKVREFTSAGGKLPKRKQRAAEMRWREEEVKRHRMAYQLQVQEKGVSDASEAGSADTQAEEMPSPKRPVNSYLLYSTEVRRLKAMSLSADIAKSWKEMPAGQKQRYIDEARLLNKEYRSAVKAVGGRPREEGKPKSPMSAYFFYVKHKRPSLVAEYRERQEPVPRNPQLTVMAAESWKNLDTAQRAPFEEMAAEAKVRHRQAVAEWSASRSLARVTTPALQNVSAEE